MQGHQLQCSSDPTLLIEKKEPEFSVVLYNVAIHDNMPIRQSLGIRVGDVAGSVAS